MFIHVVHECISMFHLRRLHTPSKMQWLLHGTPGAAQGQEEDGEGLGGRRGGAGEDGAQVLHPAVHHGQNEGHRPEEDPHRNPARWCRPAPHASFLATVKSRHHHWAFISTVQCLILTTTDMHKAPQNGFTP